MLTQSELKQIKNYLASYGKKDSQLETVPVDLDYPEETFTANDYLSVVHDAKNKIITLKNLEKVFLLTFLTDEDFREALKGKIPEEMLENACVTTEKLADGAVTTIKLGNSAVTTAKIANGAITNEKIANNTIQGAAFAANSITTDKIVDGTVTGAKLADGSIQSVDIKDNTLSGSKFVDNSISGSKIQDNAIESKHLLDNSIPASKIKDGSIENIDIKDGTLDGSKIAENTIQGSKFADNAITSTKIIDNSINTSKIADNAIITAKIVDNSITTNKINSGSVTTDKIADESVTEDKLANGAVTTDKLADGLISEIQNITDATPTTGSVKPVQSGGVKTAIDNVAFSTNEKVKNVGIDSTPTAGSDNLVKSGGIAELGYNIENPEYLKVLTDSEDKVLEGIKTDGTKEINLPTTFKGNVTIKGVITNENLTNALNAKVDKEEGKGLSTNDYTTAEKNKLGALPTNEELSDTLNNKVDKEQNKSLIDAEYASSQSTTENLEYIQVTTDSEDKILEGITTEGVKQINLPINTPSATIEHIENSEWISVITDNENKILGGRKKDGTVVENCDVEYPNGIPSGIKNYVDEKSPVSILEGKIVVWEGDSICADNEWNQTGYRKRIEENCGMTGKNYSVGGSTITSNVSPLPSGATISTRIDSDVLDTPDADYIILEGGTNDADRIGSIVSLVPGSTTDYERADESDFPSKFGTWTKSDFSGNYDKDTFCGAVEYIIWKVLSSYKGKKVGFVIAPKMGVISGSPHSSPIAFFNRLEYFREIMAICEKWGVPYINLWENSWMNPNMSNQYDYNKTKQENVAADNFYLDGQHPSPVGFDYMAKLIKDWMITL